MATYCFARCGQYALFFEACVRGWLAAILDFPQRKSDEERAAQARNVCDTLRSEVCCITVEDAYLQLVTSAWVSTYRSVEDLAEREIAFEKSVLKGTPTDEALILLRGGFSVNEAEIKNAYAQFVAQVGAGGAQTV